MAEQLAVAVAAVFRTTAEEQKTAVEEVRRNLALMEGELDLVVGCGSGHFKGRRFFGGEKLGLLDLVVGCGSFWLSIFEEVAEVKLIDEEAFPLFHGWLREFEEQEAVKETIPPADRLLEYAREVRHYLVSLPSQVKATGDDSGRVNVDPKVDRDG